jgi:hypothetical protein
MSVQYRQGDVLLIKLSDAEARRVHLEDRARPSTDRMILARGEATGHAHSVAGSTARLELRLAERYLTVWAATELTHEEHAPIRLDPGFYRVVLQREFVPSRDAEAWVRD